MTASKVAASKGSACPATVTMKFARSDNPLRSASALARAMPSGTMSTRSATSRALDERQRRPPAPQRRREHARQHQAREALRSPPARRDCANFPGPNPRRTPPHGFRPQAGFGSAHIARRRTGRLPGRFGRTWSTILAWRTAGADLSSSPQRRDDRVAHLAGRDRRLARLRDVLACAGPCASTAAIAASSRSASSPKPNE